MESISRYHKHETLKLKDNENYVLEDYSISHYAFMNLCLNHRALDCAFGEWPYMKIIQLGEFTENADMDIQYSWRL